jgi:hypothetical protein
MTYLVTLEPGFGSRCGGELVRRQLEERLDSVGFFVASRADEAGFRDWFNVLYPERRRDACCCGVRNADASTDAAAAQACAHDQRAAVTRSSHGDPS